MLLKGIVVRMDEISIIIPVYNTSKYIKKCLDSIANQTFKNLEIIIVNDGSTDDSEDIIKQWIKKNNNVKIKYFNKENEGLSEARNFGVKKAEGRYISFIDSDDYIEQNLYENLKKYMDDNIDLIKFKMKMINESGEIIKKIDGPVFEKCSGEEAFKKICTLDKYIDPACIYLYRREFFIENKFAYRIGTYHEDFGLTSLIIVSAKTFVSVKEYGYNYMQRNDSITGKEDKKKNVQKAKDLLKHYDNMIEKIEIYNISNQTKDLVKRYYTNAVILKALELVNYKIEYKNYINEIKKRKLYKNIKIYNIKQLIKRMILKFNIKLYLKMK